MPKRLPTERVPLTDEWGIYDPAKAGMEALFARLGRPVLRGSGKKIRQERRHTFRPERERSAEGVGLAIKEAMDRVGAMDRAALEAKAAAAPPETAAEAMEGAPLVPASPARAVRVAVKAAKSAKTPALMLEEAAAKAAAELVVVPEPPAAAVKRKAARRTKAETAVVAAPVAEAETAAVLAEPAPKTVRVRKTAKPRVKVEPAAAAVIAAPAPVATAPALPAPPAPSPRRPRGPVPLAAWAHAVTDATTPEPRRADQRGFWKGIFRIPSDVALVEYAHGCRIHRLLIETSDELPMLDLI